MTDAHYDYVLVKSRLKCEIYIQPSSVTQW
jgi:hypothetical protein